MRLLFLPLIAACAACSFPGTYDPSQVTIDPLSGNALFADVVTYHDFGTHQSGSEGDNATSNWIAKELGLAGYDVTFQPWDLRQYSVTRCELTVGGAEVDSYPFWYPHTTGADPVRGELVALPDEPEEGSLDGKIVFLPSDREGGRRVYQDGVNAAADRAAAAGAVGLVMVVPTRSGDLAAINARVPYHQETLPIPCVIAAPNDEPALAAAVAENKIATIRIEGEDNPGARAMNVIGELRRGPKWIVVTTPSSGWFTCAGERGPGVALFLGIARWAAGDRLPHSIRFIANSGHELDNLGAHESLEKYGPPVDEVACWLHLGASIGTRLWDDVNGEWKPLDEADPIGNLVASEQLMPLLNNTFSEVSWLEPRSDGPVAGELRHFLEAGYNSFGLYSGHHFFHTRLDTPATTEAKFLEPVARALAKTLSMLPK